MKLQVIDNAIAVITALRQAFAKIRREDQRAPRGYVGAPVVEPEAISIGGSEIALSIRTDRGQP